MRQQEPVELALRQGIGALELHRVLRGDHHERSGQRMRLAVGRHLPLAHRLQQCALRPRRRPVDLVGQHDVGEDRSRTEEELVRLAVVEAAAGDVGRQQVGGELDAVEPAGEAAGNGLAHQGLAHAGHVFQQNVFAGQQRDYRQAHHVRLAEDHAGNILLQLGDKISGFIGHRGQLLRSNITAAAFQRSRTGLVACRTDLLRYAVYTSRRGGATAGGPPGRVQLTVGWVKVAQASGGAAQTDQSWFRVWRPSKPSCRDRSPTRISVCLTHPTFCEKCGPTCSVSGEVARFALACASG